MINKNYKSISEVSKLLNIEQHVIRYWDSKFNGISTRLNNNKRRCFNSTNIAKLQTLKNLLHTNGKSHHSLEMARKLIEDNVIVKKINFLSKKTDNKLDINKLIKVSINLKNLLK